MVFHGESHDDKARRTVRTEVTIQERQRAVLFSSAEGMPPDSCHYAETLYSQPRLTWRTWSYATLNRNFPKPAGPNLAPINQLEPSTRNTPGIQGGFGERFNSVPLQPTFKLLSAHTLNSVLGLLITTAQANKLSVLTVPGFLRRVEKNTRLPALRNSPLSYPLRHTSRKTSRLSPCLLKISSAGIMRFLRSEMDEA
jgi:hypothetical protein